MKKIFLILLVFLVSFSQGQNTDTIYTPAGFLKIKNNKDSVPYNKDYFFNEGIYLSYDDFRQCNAIPRSLILTRVEKNQLEFYHKLIESQDTIVYRKGGGISISLINDIFCFVQNNTVYLNVEGTFCRILVFGNVSHFIGNISSEAFKADGQFYDPYMSGGGSSITGNPLRTKETREFLFDFYSGETILANEENLEKFLRRDNIIFEEYNKLSKKQKRKKIYYYLR
ncbi:MAG: hypothetical protein ACK452_00430, partial [Bacteroidota bacterium]